jgi:hypothetical protein
LTNTSILRTALSTRYWRPFGWLRASRLLPPRSGLERSDFVHWLPSFFAAAHQFGSDPTLTGHAIGAVDPTFLTRHVDPAVRQA